MHRTTEREQEAIAALIARCEREGLICAGLSRTSGIAVWRLRYRGQPSKATRVTTTTAIVPRSSAHAFYRSRSRECRRPADLLGQNAVDRSAACFSLSDRLRRARALRMIGSTPHRSDVDRQPRRSKGVVRESNAP